MKSTALPEAVRAICVRRSTRLLLTEKPNVSGRSGVLKIVRKRLQELVLQWSRIEVNMIFAKS